MGKEWDDSTLDADYSWAEELKPDQPSVIEAKQQSPTVPFHSEEHEAIEAFAGAMSEGLVAPIVVHRDSEATEEPQTPMSVQSSAASTQPATARVGPNSFPTSEAGDTQPKDETHKDDSFSGHGEAGKQSVASSTNRMNTVQDGETSAPDRSLDIRHSGDSNAGWDAEPVARMPRPPVNEREDGTDIRPSEDILLRGVDSGGPELPEGGDEQEIGKSSTPYRNLGLGAGAEPELPTGNRSPSQSSQTRKQQPVETLMPSSSRPSTGVSGLTESFDYGDVSGDGEFPPRSSSYSEGDDDLPSDDEDDVF